MNNTIFSLFKVHLKQAMDFRGKNKKNLAIFVPIGLILLLGCLLSGLYSLSIVMILKEANVDLSLVVYTMAGATSIFILSTAIPKVKNVLFGGKDYEMLAALPIRKSSIIAVKFLSVYLTEILFSFALVVPATIIVLIHGGRFSILFDGILLVLFSPLVPLIISCFVGMLFGVIADRFKYGNILTILFYSIFLIGIMYISFSFSSAGPNEDLSSIVDSLRFISWLNPSTYILYIDLLGLNLLLYFLVHGILFVGLSFFVGFGYDYFHHLMTAKHSILKYVEKDVKVKGQFKAQFTMDLKRYASSKAYLMNTITGGILSVLLIIIMVIIFYQMDEPDVVSVLRGQVAPYLPILIFWCSSMAFPSNVAISIEGKYFWQAKSLPVDYKTYSYSKILLSEVVIAPFILVSSIILLFFMDLSVVRVITTIVLPQLYFFAINCFGYLINMKFYTLKWENEMRAVKQSSSAILTMLLDFIASIGVAVIFILIGIWVSYDLAALLAILVCLGLGLVGWILIQRNCQRLISKIEV